MKRILFFLLVLISISALAQSSQVTTLAGSSQGYQDGIGTSAQFKQPNGIAIDNAGNLFITDTGNHCIRKITPAGVVSTFAGSNSPGYINGNGSMARFNLPMDLEFDLNGDLLVTDSGNHCIRKITPAGVVSTFTGTGIAGYVEGNINIAQFNSPLGIAIGYDGTIYVSDFYARLIRKITTSGQVTTLAGETNGGYTDGQGVFARFSDIRKIVVDANNNLFVTDLQNQKIRKIDQAGNVTTFAGSIMGYQNGVGINAFFRQPNGICFDNNGNLLVTDEINYRVRKITPNATVSTIAGDGTIGSTDGAAMSSNFSYLAGIEVDNQGNMYVCDNGNNRIRKISPNLTAGNSCATATALTTNSGTINIGTINGSIPSSSVCYTYSQANPNANWWSFTPTQNGVLTLTTATAQNATSIDTRISIFNGTCTTLNCYSGNDNISSTDLRSNLSNIILAAGTTYYFVFDDKVSDNAAVNFYYEFNPQTCFRPSSINVGNVFTETAESVVWTAPVIGDVNPDFYTLEIGPAGYTLNSAAALQSITNVNALTYTFTGLTAGTQYDIYIKSNCSTTDSSVWFGPYRIVTEFVAVNPTYTENFDSEASFLYTGWTRSGGNNSTMWRTYTSGPNAFTQNGANSIYSITNPVVNTPTNVYAYTRKLNLVSGQNYNVSYHTRQVLGSGVSTFGFLQVNYVPNADYTNTATQTQINALTVITDQNYINQNHNFTVPTNGEYRIAFRNALQRTSTSSTSATAWLMVDNVVVSTALSVNEFEKFGLISYPNPVLDYITIQNPENIVINSYSVVDLNGRILQNNALLNDTIIDLTSLPKGIYFIQLNTEKGILIKKIIKE